MTLPGWRSRPDRQWRAVRETPLAALAETLVQGDGLHQQLVDLGWSGADHRSTLAACGFDNQNGWHWLDVTVDPSRVPAWLDPKKQRQVRTLLNTRLVYFKLKPTGDLIRVWWKSPRNKGIRLVKD